MLLSENEMKQIALEANRWVEQLSKKAWPYSVQKTADEFAEHLKALNARELARDFLHTTK